MEGGDDFAVGVVGGEAEFGVDFVGEFVDVFEALGLVVDGFHGDYGLVGQVGLPEAVSADEFIGAANAGGGEVKVYRARRWLCLFTPL